MRKKKGWSPKICKDLITQRYVEGQNKARNKVIKLEEQAVEIKGKYVQNENLISLKVRNYRSSLPFLSLWTEVGMACKDSKRARDSWRFATVTLSKKDFIYFILFYFQAQVSDVCLQFFVGVHVCPCMPACRIISIVFIVSSAVAS